MRHWCLWWVLATCGDLQVENYMSTLWEFIEPSQANEDVYNGGVTACATLAGIVVTLVLSKNTHVDWSEHGDMLLVLLSVLECGVLLVAASTASLWVAYGMYVVFAATYTLLITIASAEVARSMTTSNYALVYGFNMLLALSLQSILTAVVNNESLNFPIQTQFQIYSGFFGAIGILFLVLLVWSSCQSCKSK